MLCPVPGPRCQIFTEEEGGHQDAAGAICPVGVGVEEKGDRQEPAQGTVSGSAWTPFLRPICLGSPLLH